MASFNKVILIGNLVADPELKQTPAGVSVTSFDIGVSRRFSDASGQRVSDFFHIVAWRTTAEFITKYFAKGDSILVCGQLQQRSWTDGNGQKRYTVEVVAEEATFVTAKAAANPHNAIPTPTEQATQSQVYTPTQARQTDMMQAARQTPTTFSDPTVTSSGMTELPDEEDLPF